MPPTERAGGPPTRQALFYEKRPWPTDGPAKDEPWLRWSDETERDYARFQVFRDLPPPRRDLATAARVYAGTPLLGHGSTDRPVAPQVFKSLSKKWRWAERCDAFDRWKEKSQLEAERDGTLEAWREMGERHAREAMALQQKALERLRSLNPSELSAAEVRQFLVQAATLERLARGASLQDMARVQREKEEAAAKEGVAVITYVDDWRGDASRSKRNPNSFYGNGQGYLPTTGDAEVPLPESPPGPDRGDEGPPPVHVPQRRKKVAKDHHGDDARGGGGDQR